MKNVVASSLSEALQFIAMNSDESKFKIKIECKGNILSDVSRQLSKDERSDLPSK